MFWKNPCIIIESYERLIIPLPKKKKHSYDLQLKIKMLVRFNCASYKKLITQLYTVIKQRRNMAKFLGNDFEM